MMLLGNNFSVNSPLAMLFSWLVQDPNIQNSAQNRIGIFYRSLDAYWEDHEVTTPLLKFMAELCHNKV